MKKILASDYDGTFYTSDEEIYENINSVKEFRERDNIFIIATGRSYYDFNKKLQIYPMEFDYLIINQGATILNKNNEVISNYPIDEDTKDSLINDLNLKDEDNMFACSRLESRVSINENNITKIHRKFENVEEASEINKKINEKYKNKIISYLLTSSNSIEIISAKTNKAEAIKIIADIENVKNEEIYTIGDGYNDIEMLSKFNGGCMENAPTEIKNICKNRYRSVSELINEFKMNV